MKLFGRIVLINIGVILLYSAIIRLTSGGSRSSGSMAGMAIISAIVVLFHVFFCLIVAAVGWSDREKGRAWLGTAAVVLVVGFSVCLGNTAL